MRRFVRSIIVVLKSTRLVPVLIVCIGVLSIVGTVIPQGRRVSYYINTYPSFAAELILLTNTDRISRSLFTVIPVILLLLNLLTCTASRLYDRFRNAHRNRFGPDIIHISLILLIIGGYLSISGRSSLSLYLTKGDIGVISDEYTLYLKDLTFSTYEDGRTREWISIVELRKNGFVIGEQSVAINKPLKVKEGKVYLSDYRKVQSVVLLDDAGKETRLDQGSLLGLDRGVFRYIGNSRVSDIESAQFTAYGGNAGTAYTFGRGEYFDRYRIGDLSTREQVGLTYTVDPGARMVFLSLFIMTAGLALTICQKMKDKKI